MGPGRRAGLLPGPGARCGSDVLPPARDGSAQDGSATLGLGNPADPCGNGGGHCRGQEVTDGVRAWELVPSTCVAMTVK